MAPQEDSTGPDLNPQLAEESDTERRGGLEPEAFQRELVFVTATVLILGVVGGSCLGMKIQRAEHRSNERVEQTQTEPSQSERTPSVTPERQTPGSEPEFGAE